MRRFGGSRWDSRDAAPDNRPAPLAQARPGARRKAAPRAYGWCRMRWSGATLAVELKTQQGLEVSACTVRRWLHAMAWVWTREPLVANADDPQRVERWARMRFPAEPWQAHEVRGLADALDIHLCPTVGAAWRPHGNQEDVMPPGTHAMHDRAGALHLTTGERHQGRSARHTHARFRDRRTRLDDAYHAPRSTRIDVVVDHDGRLNAKTVEPWRDTHPRVD